MWKILEEMVADFRRREVVIPEKVMNDLKSARTLIKILKADSSYEEAVQKIELYHTNVESFLVSEGQKRFGAEYVDEWLKRLGEACKRIAEEDEEEIRFVPGLPREQKWIRVRPSAELPLKKLEVLAQESELSCKMQIGGSLLVYGKDEDVKNFVKKMATKYRLKAEK
jgi:hypothetical protein